MKDLFKAEYPWKVELVTGPKLLEESKSKQGPPGLFLTRYGAGNQMEQKTTTHL